MINKKYFFVIVLMFALLSSVVAQKKKEIKKLKIKSVKTMVTEMVDGKETTRQDMFERFDNNGNRTEETAYNKDGSFKKKETAKYNRENDKTEEVHYDEKGLVTKKTTFEYDDDEKRISRN